MGVQLCRQSTMCAPILAPSAEEGCMRLTSDPMNPPAGMHGCVVRECASRETDFHDIGKDHGASLASSTRHSRLLGSPRAPVLAC
ncbi:hypothetical protein CBOM_07596 [Ceraceosorus bombacis]|uniref:Uncharacterized protein n=1 Tax=Ceraceosorus bombacis TaxID=401625 RepID=A0A0P1BHD2_9BASI|nr:hypothetical protein CBOM_07596 [Ceraceosorus bombacis]